MLQLIEQLAYKVIGTDIVLTALLASHPQRDDAIKQINKLVEELAEFSGKPVPDLILGQVRLLTRQLEQEDADDNP